MKHAIELLYTIPDYKDASKQLKEAEKNIGFVKEKEKQKAILFIIGIIIICIAIFLNI